MFNYYRPAMSPLTVLFWPNLSPCLLSQLVLRCSQSVTIVPNQLQYWQSVTIHIQSVPISAVFVTNVFWFTFIKFNPVYTSNLVVHDVQSIFRSNSIKFGTWIHNILAENSKIIWGHVFLSWYTCTLSLQSIIGTDFENRLQ